MKKIFYYFVSYAISKSSSYFFGVSCAELRTHKEITSFHDIDEIMKFIEKKHKNEAIQVAILNYKLLRIEEGEEEVEVEEESK